MWPYTDNMFSCGLPCCQVDLAAGSAAVDDSGASVACPSFHAPSPAQPSSPTPEAAEPAETPDPIRPAEPNNSGLCSEPCCPTGHTVSTNPTGIVQLAEAASTVAGSSSGIEVGELCNPPPVSSVPGGPCDQVGEVTLDLGSPAGTSVRRYVSDSLFRHLLAQKGCCDGGTSSQQGCGLGGAPGPGPPGPNSSDSDHESDDGSDPFTLESPTDSEADFGCSFERDMVGMVQLLRLSYVLGMQLACTLPGYMASGFELPPNPH